MKSGTMSPMAGAEVLVDVIVLSECGAVSWDGGGSRERMRFWSGDFSLTPALSRWEREQIWSGLPQTSAGLAQAPSPLPPTHDPGSCSPESYGPSFPSSRESSSRAAVVLDAKPVTTVRPERSNERCSLVFWIPVCTGTTCNLTLGPHLPVIGFRKDRLTLHADV